MTKAYKAVIHAGHGTLLGGVLKHESSPFASKRAASDFLRQAVSTNRQAGRDVAESYLKTVETKRPLYVTKTQMRKNPARRSRKKTKRKIRITRARRNPRGRYGIKINGRVSHTLVFSSAKAAARYAKSVGGKKFALKKSGYKAHGVKFIKHNPSPVNYSASAGKRTGFYCIEGLVRDSPHDRKFSYWYYTGTGFSKDRKESFCYPNKFAAEGTMRKIVNRLPSKVLQVRAIPY